MLSYHRAVRGGRGFTRPSCLSAKGGRASMREEVMEQKIDTETCHSGGKTFTEILKKNAKELTAHNCKGCAKREDTVRKIAAVGGKAAVGLGTGVCLGVGALAVAAAAEVAIPAILTFKALALTGGALGLVKGAKDFNK